MSSSPMRPNQLVLRPDVIGRDLASIPRVRRVVRAFVEATLPSEHTGHVNANGSNGSNGGHGSPGSGSNDARGSVDMPDRIPANVVSDVLLVVSELLTNSLIHTEHAPSLVVRRVHDPDRIEIEVTDRSGAIPALRDPDGIAEGGRGLQIVSQVAAAWGVRLVGEGKATWAVIPVG